MKTHNGADDCQQVQQLTDSESDSVSPLTAQQLSDNDIDVK